MSEGASVSRSQEVTEVAGVCSADPGLVSKKVSWQWEKPCCVAFSEELLLGLF